jgi:hypothetical protein
LCTSSPSRFVPKPETDTVAWVTAKPVPLGIRGANLDVRSGSVDGPRRDRRKSF